MSTGDLSYRCAVATGQDAYVRSLALVLSIIQHISHGLYVCSLLHVHQPFDSCCNVALLILCALKSYVKTMDIYVSRKGKEVHQLFHPYTAYLFLVIQHYSMRTSARNPPGLYQVTINLVLVVREISAGT